MGQDFQGSDDNDGRNRQTCPSFGYPGIQRGKHKGNAGEKKEEIKKDTPHLRCPPVSLLRSALRDDLHATEVGSRGERRGERRKRSNPSPTINQTLTNRRLKEIKELAVPWVFLIVVKGISNCRLTIIHS